VSKILITGAAGNLGGKLAAHFRAKDYTLVLLDRIAQPPDSDIETADLSRWGDWKEHFKGIDCVIHLAADGRIDADWESVARHNIDATLNVFEAAAHHGVKRVVFASSTWVMEGYRKSGMAIGEDLRPRPVNAYGASKLAGERIARSFSETRGISVICFRIGACLADNRPGLRVSPALWEQQKWLSNHDLCRAFELAVEAPRPIAFEVFNLMSRNEGMRWDMGKAQRLLGFRAEDASVPVLPPLKKRLSRKLRELLGLRRVDYGPRVAP
jgi:NAD+ dependent glucose-6-phosphate dehydrogenase